MEAKLWNWNPLLLPPRFSSLKHAFPSTTTRLVAHNSVSETVPIHKEKEQTLPSVKPTYSPTPPNRGLRTPHSGHELMLGNTFEPNQNSKPPNKEVPPQHVHAIQTQ
ncbi:hypothetical protein JHK85_009667 [Glycine max]|nr:hypothetical protein JHK85_009667 [Glycine max]